jgi:riboflavin kinase/FMN adenylyltransferase
VELGVATFEPAPRRHFQPDAPPFRLMTPLQRQLAMDGSALEQLHLLRFDAVMAAMTDREFCERVILGEVGARRSAWGSTSGSGRTGWATLTP